MPLNLKHAINSLVLPKIIFFQMLCMLKSSWIHLTTCQNDAGIIKHVSYGLALIDGIVK